MISFDGKTSKNFRTNVGMVYSAIITGIGFAGCATLCNSIWFQVFSKGMYYGHCTFLYKNMEYLSKKDNEVVLTILQNLQAEEHRVDSDVDVDAAQVATAPTAACAANGAAGANDDAGVTYLDLDVSFNGTWMKCGHKSHICVPFVVHVQTGFIVDYEVVSNFCELCTKKKASVSADLSCLERNS